MEKKFKITLCVLLTILLAVIAFAGVYSKNGLLYESAMPEYTLDSELTGKRITYFEVADGTSKDELTEENFEKVKRIFNGRFEEIGVSDYRIRENMETGELVVELAENSSTDLFLQYLLYKGDFSFTDSDDGTVLLSRDDVEKASVVYGNSGTGQITVYLQIKFNKEGTEKLAEVSKTYIKLDATEEGSETVADDQKLVTLTIEGTEILTTYFAEEMKDGNLTISLGSGTDSSSILELARQGGIFAMLINNDEMPITYTADLSETVESELGENALSIIIISLSVIAGAVILYMAFKYNVDGVLCGVAFVAGISILLIILRYTGATISLGGFASMLALIVIQTYFMIGILKKISKDGRKDNVIATTIEVFTRNASVILVTLIIAIVFTFMQETRIFSIGMILFYGLISLAIANLAFMRTMLIANHK